MEEAIRRAIDLKIRPLVSVDGGDIELVSVKDGIATVRLFGACDDCPMSPVTLRASVERILKDEVPEIRGVLAVQD